MQKPVPPRISRRDAIKLLSLGAGAWFFAACNPAPGESRASPTATPSSPAGHSPAQTPGPSATDQPTSTPEITEAVEISGMPSLPEGFEAGRITTTADFYEQSYNGVAKPDQFEWRLSLTGLVDTPLELSLTDLKLRPSFEVMRTLECIGNWVGGTLIGNATWKGVSLKALVEEAGLQPEAKFILFRSADDYETSVSVDLVQDERSLLVYEMNGEPLTVSHGFPARILLPGVYGQKQPKWITSMHAAERDRLGTWEKKGWSNTAVIQINSRIETPRLRQYLPAGQPFFVTGIAMADTSGVRSVEVSLDDGVNWMPADLLQGPDSGVWTLWHWEWKDPQPGNYIVVARATDGSGTAQTASGTFGVLDNVFPDGTSLMHALSVTVL